MMKKLSNKFFKTTDGMLAEELHDTNGQVIGEEIICHAYLYISERLRMPNNTYVYRLSIEDPYGDNFSIDSSASHYFHHPIRIRYKLAERCVIPPFGMDSRLNAYLKQIGRAVMHKLEAKPWHPIE